jgi:hypothetical protein
MTLSAGCVRQMKTTGLQTRPLDQGRPHRMIAPVKRCVLALLLERAAEIRCQQTWRTIRQTVDHLKVVRYRRQGKTLVQSTRVTSPRAEILQRLGIPLPKKSLEVFEETSTTHLA